jgi:hypothetical protein
MKTLNDLKNEWHELVATYEDEARLAWRTVDVEGTDIEGEYQYYSELINTVKRILQ